MKKRLNDEMSLYLEFLDEYKQYIGLTDWNIKIATEAIGLGDAHAEAEANIWNKEIKVTLSTSFLSLSNEEKANVLFHELVHARFSIYEKRVEEITAQEEETFINDIVRGHERKHTLFLKSTKKTSENV